jgi:hypothetical protein
MKTLAFLLSISTLALAACGTSTLGGNGGGAGHGGDSGIGGGGTDLCGPSPVSCSEVSCPDGYTCVADADPSMCHPSQCDCDKGVWVCSDDCMMNGSTCRQNPITCQGQPSPVNCEGLGCPDGWTCTPDPDPATSCHPSSCQCDIMGWMCTADCGTGSTCVKGL